MTRALVAGAFVVTSLLACGAETLPVASSSESHGATRPRVSPPPALESSVRTCALVTSCARSGDAVSLRDPAACVDRLLLMKDPRHVCLGAARSCADVDACLERPHTSGEAAKLCAERRGINEFCLGTSLVTCEGEPSITRCYPGEQCGQTTLASGLVIRGCSSPCPTGAPPTRCSRGAIIACGPGMPAERTACPTGSRCVELRQPEGDVEATCERRPCVPGRGRCNGTRVESCVVGEDGRGGLVETDCAAAGLSCLTSGTSASCVAGSNCEHGPARCEGAALRVCAAGVSVLAHCQRWGLGPCRVQEGGIASCAPPPSPPSR